MTVIEEQQFGSVFDRGEARIYSDIEFRNCYFEGCAVMSQSPEQRSAFRNIKLVDCSQRGCGMEAVILENVVIENLDTKGQLLQLWGVAFNKVVMRGQIDRVMISSIIDIMGDRPEMQNAFDVANAEFYENVEWAVDIREAQFKELDIRGVPGSLIRRDPETQVLIRRENAVDGRWKDLPFREGLWKTALSLWIKDGKSDVVLAAPRRHKKFENYVADLRMLREAGVAERD